MSFNQGLGGTAPATSTSYHSTHLFFTFPSPDLTVRGPKVGWLSTAIVQRLGCRVKADGIKGLHFFHIYEHQGIKWTNLESGNLICFLFGIVFLCPSLQQPHYRAIKSWDCWKVKIGDISLFLKKPLVLYP